MMEIKFRAWDKEKKEMFPVWRMDFSIEPSAEVKDYDGDGFFIRCIKSKYVMQFTGLQDKNGKDIYEGDIVNKIQSGYKTSLVVKYDFHGDHSSYMYQLGWNLWEEEIYEIIGNIHKNPELK